MPKAKPTHERKLLGNCFYVRKHKIVSQTAKTTSCLCLFTQNNPMLPLAESFEACRISKMRHDTSEIRISDKKIGMIDQS